ncbi:hypothetical protein [Halomarina oriensis]|nr:hypothetical protein [Halomarina oriensis]
MTSSEWVYSDDSGDLARIDSADHFSPVCEHVSPQGKSIDVGL